MLTFSFCLVLQPTRKEAKNIAKEKQIITSKEDENNTTPCAHTNNELQLWQRRRDAIPRRRVRVRVFVLFSLPRVYKNERERERDDDDESFWKHF